MSEKQDRHSLTLYTVMLLCTGVAKLRSRAPYCHAKKGERPVRRTILHGVTVTLAALWMVCCSAVWRAEAASNTFPAPYGPLRLVNQQPVQLLFLQPFPIGQR